MPDAFVLPLLTTGPSSVFLKSTVALAMPALVPDSMTMTISVPLETIGAVGELSSEHDATMRSATQERSAGFIFDLA
jgi:hypothetical protein